jgi:hypothetical protein
MCHPNIIVNIINSDKTRTISCVKKDDIGVGGLE